VTTGFNAASWTASDLLTEVYRACRLPDSGTIDYTPTAVLSEATNEIWGSAGHIQASARNGRLATSILRAVTSSSVATSGQDYELPPMAVGDTIDSVTWVNAAGTQELPLQVIPLGLETDWGPPTVVGEPTHYALLADTLRILPRPSVSGSLRITYQRRHSMLVAGSDTASVTAVVDNGGFARVTLTSTPASFVAAAWLDFIGVTYPYRTKIHGASITTAHGSNQFTLGVTYASFVAASLVGDTAVIYGRTPYVHLPMEMRSFLVARVAGKIARQLGDIQLAALHDAAAAQDGKRAAEILTPRTKYAREKAHNPRSLLRGRMRGWWG
jgi:hypothetical protein